MSDGNAGFAYKVRDSWNAYDWEAVVAIHSPDYVDHTAPPGTEGLPFLKMKFDMFCSAFPDFKLTIDDTFATGNKAVWRWTMTGTHKGDFLGVPATGKEVTLSAITIARIEDGLCHEAWAEVNMMGLMQQLGVISS